MTTHVTTITPDTPLEKVASLMVDKKFHTLPVVDNGRLVGIVGKKDVIQTLLRA
jgi:CBS domain-containing protein